MTLERCLLLRPSSMLRVLENLPCKLILLSLNEGECGWGGDLEGNKVETTKNKNTFLQQDLQCPGSYIY